MTDSDSPKRRDIRIDGQPHEIKAPIFTTLGTEDLDTVQLDVRNALQFLRWMKAGRMAELLDGKDREVISPAVLNTPYQADGKVTLGQLLETARPTIERLQSVINTEPKTGLYRCEVFMKRLEQLLKGFAEQQRKKDNEPFAVVLTDIDHFKSFNDDFGHLPGDMVLKQVAETLMRAIRTEPGGEDIAARFGGEEFALILGGVGNEADLQAVMDKLHQLQHKYVHEDSTQRDVTLSMGGVICTPDTSKGKSVNDILKAADALLYDVKEGGRNGYKFMTRDGEAGIVRHGEAAAERIVDEAK